MIATHSYLKSHDSVNNYQEPEENGKTHCKYGLNTIQDGSIRFLLP